LDRLNEDLNDVTRIMTKNIQDVLGRGENLDRTFLKNFTINIEGMSVLSQSLSEESKKYLRDTKRLNMQALWQKYGPVLIVVAIVLIVFWLRSRFF
jgi:vesicle transport protein SEC22